jgi:hypothetical protein
VIKEISIKGINLYPFYYTHCIEYGYTLLIVYTRSKTYTHISLSVYHRKDRVAYITAMTYDLAVDYSIIEVTSNNQSLYDRNKVLVAFYNIKKYKLEKPIWCRDLNSNSPIVK